MAGEIGMAPRGRAPANSLQALMAEMVPPLGEWTTGQIAIGAGGANEMPPLGANEVLQMMPIEVGVEEHIDAATRRQVGRNLCQHLFDQFRERAERECWQDLGSAFAIEAFDLVAFQVKPPGERELDGTELQA